MEYGEAEGLWVGGAGSIGRERPTVDGRIVSIRPIDASRTIG